MTPLVAVISPKSARLVPNTAAPSNWLRTLSGCDYGACIHSSPHAGNVHLSLVVHLDFYYGSDVSQEAAVGGNAEAVSLTLGFFTPARFLGRDLYHAPQATRVEG